jgi:hypothetical protein
MTDMTDMNGITRAPRIPIVLDVAETENTFDLGLTRRRYKELFYDAEMFLIPAPALKLLICIYRHEEGGRPAWLSIEHLANVLDMNKDSVKKWKKYLLDEKWMVVLPPPPTATGKFPVTAYRVTLNRKPVSAMTDPRKFQKFFCDRDEVFLLPPVAFKVWLYCYLLEIGNDRQSTPGTPQELTVKFAIKDRHTIADAFTYLIDNDWLKVLTEARKYRVIRGSIPRERDKRRDNDPTEARDAKEPVTKYTDYKEP